MRLVASKENTIGAGNSYEQVVSAGSLSLSSAKIFKDNRITQKLWLFCAMIGLKQHFIKF